MPKFCRIITDDHDLQKVQDNVARALRGMEGVAGDESPWNAALAAHAALVSGVHGLPAAVGWQTALDLDFSIQAAQTLATDADYTIGGTVWTKVNSASDASAMAIAPGQGLVIQPVSNTDLYQATRTLPAVTTNLSSLVPNLSLDTPVRVWWYIAAHNCAADYDGAVCAVEDPTVNNWNQILAKGYWAPSLKLDSTINVANVNWGEVFSTAYAAHDVMVLEMPLGIPVVQIGYRSGIYASGWPSATSLQPLAYRGPVSNVPTTQEAAGAASLWRVLCGARRAGSATALSVTFGRVKVEYRV